MVTVLPGLHKSEVPAVGGRPKGLLRGRGAWAYGSALLLPRPPPRGGLVTLVSLTSLQGPLRSPCRLRASLPVSAEVTSPEDLSHVWEPVVCPGLRRCCLLPYRALALDRSQHPAHSTPDTGSSEGAAVRIGDPEGLLLSHTGLGAWRRLSRCAWASATV